MRLRKQSEPVTPPNSPPVSRGPPGPPPPLSSGTTKRRDNTKKTEKRNSSTLGKTVSAPTLSFGADNLQSAIKGLRSSTRSNLTRSSTAPPPSTNGITTASIVSKYIQTLPNENGNNKKKNGNNNDWD